MFEDVDKIGKSDLAKRLGSMVISIVLHFVLVIAVIVFPLVFKPDKKQGTR